MSSYMWGRYIGVEDMAAVEGKVPKVRPERPVAGRRAEGARGDTPEAINFAGFGGSAVFALIPGEALALYTTMTNPKNWNQENWGSAVHNNRFWILLIVALVTYVMGRFANGRFASLRKVITDDRRSKRRRSGFAAGELARALAPVFALTAWLLGAQTEIGKTAAWPDWGLPGIDVNDFGILARATFFAILAWITLGIANLVGFKDMVKTTALRDAGGNEPAGNQ